MIKYIEFAEQIHKFNDERYNIKRKINLKYNSTLIEEKIYKNNSNIKQKIIITKNDHEKLNQGKLSYTHGEYKKSYKILNSLMEKFSNYEYYNDFYVTLLFAYDIILNIYNYENNYNDKIHEIMSNIDNLEIMNELKESCKSQYLIKCLNIKNFKKAFKYLNTINYITGPNVSYKNMSFFKNDDVNKTLLIYDGGVLVIN